MLKSNSFDVPRHTAMKRLDPKVGLLAASAAALSALLLRRRRRPAPVLGSLAGKVVVVTGASRGLGLEFARAPLARAAVAELDGDRRSRVGGGPNTLDRDPKGTLG